MAYDEGLAQRVREELENKRGITEKKMFGGLCFLLRGNMVCGITSVAPMVRVGKEAYEECLALPHAREMDFTKRPLRGMVYVDDAGIESDADLAAWVGRGMAFAKTLPAK